MQKLAVPIALVLGAILGFTGKALISSTDSGSSGASESAEMAQLRSENAKLRAELDKPADPAPSAIVKSGSVKSPQSKIVVANTGENGEKKFEFDMAAMQEKARETQQRRDEKANALQFAILKNRLGLSEEQAEKVTALLDARSEKQRARLGRMFSLADGEGDKSGEVLELLSPSAESFDQDLIALLDDDQKEAYSEYLDDKRTNEIEATANRDLASLQSMFSLSDEQKDKAFEAFTSLAADTVDEQGQQGGFDPKKFMSQRQSRLDALAPILTPDQMELYKESPIGSGQVMFGTSTLGGSAVIQSIAVDVPDGAAVTTEAITIEVEE